MVKGKIFFQTGKEMCTLFYYSMKILSELKIYNILKTL